MITGFVIGSSSSSSYSLMLQCAAVAGRHDYDDL